MSTPTARCRSRSAGVVMLAPTVAATNMVVMLHSSGELRSGSIRRLGGLASRTVVLSALHTLEQRGVIRSRRLADGMWYSPDRESPYYQAAHTIALVDLPIAACLGPMMRHVDAVYATGPIARGSETCADPLSLVAVGDLDAAEITSTLAPIGHMLARRISVRSIRGRAFAAATAEGFPAALVAKDGVRLLSRRLPAEDAAAAWPDQPLEPVYACSCGERAIGSRICSVATP